MKSREVALDSKDCWEFLRVEMEEIVPTSAPSRICFERTPTWGAMGQRIEVTATVIDDVLVLDTDRTLTGQDGAAYQSSDAASADRTFPGLLAARVFEADDAVAAMFVASNAVVVRREGGWNDGCVAATTGILSDFFLFYSDSAD